MNAWEGVALRLKITSRKKILFFVPYLYLFGAYLRLRRRRTAGTALVGWTGLGAVALSIGLSFVPPAVGHPLVFEVNGPELRLTVPRAALAGIDQHARAKCHDQGNKCLGANVQVSPGLRL